ncbi:Response regulator containing a CheY-like receiver domain and an HTH DNA-binding domain [Legionella spiritensis]|nr:Response regulator containing a CheY-like receiver domain and an HTH DNA-binding domain [Legionella spiritensis]
MFPTRFFETMIQQSNLVNEIVGDAFAVSPIKYFSYLEIFEDHTFTLLSSDACSFTCSIQENLIESYLNRMIHADHKNNKFNFYDLNNQLFQHHSANKYDHYFRVIDKSSKTGNSVRVFTFAANKETETVNQYYLNHFCHIENFNHYFANRFKHVSPRIAKPIPSTILPKQNKRENFNHNKFHLDEKYNQLHKKVTHREWQLLLLASQGFTAKNIGDFLGISKKTADNIFANVRKKFQINNTKEIIKLLFQ